MKKKRMLFALAVILFLLSACGSEKPSADDYVVKLYYVGNAETKVVMREHVLLGTSVEEQIEEIMEMLATPPAKLEYKPPLAMGFALKDYRLENSMLTLNMDSGYRELNPVAEVLTRAALVRSFTQLRSVMYVKITVEGEPLYDSLGNVVGRMAGDRFIDNAGNEINTYEEAKLKLYFANESGDGLVSVNRNLYYNTNVPTEKLVIEQILAGVSVTDTGCYPTINPETKLINVMVKDEICYVNLDKTFLAQIYGVTPEVTIYSLVNSLTELSNINKVQILVEGETDVMYRESIMLTTLFERNPDLIQ